MILHFRAVRAGSVFAGLAALGLAVTPPAGRCDVAQDAGYTIRRTFSVGDVRNYRIVVKTSVTDAGVGVADLDVILKLKLKEAVKETRPDGSTQLVYTVPEQTMTTTTKQAGPQEMDLKLTLPEVVQIVNKAGRTTSVNFESSDAILAQNLASMVRVLLQTEDLFYPTTAVKVGDSWKVDSAHRGADGKPVTWRGTATVTSVETVDGAQALKIHVVADESGVPDLTPHIDADADISTSDGRVVKVDGSVTDVTPQAKKLAITLAQILNDAAPEAKQKP